MDTITMHMDTITMPYFWIDLYILAPAVMKVIRIADKTNLMY